MVCQEKIAGVLRAVCGKPAEFSVCCGETEVCIKGADVQRAEKQLAQPLGAGHRLGGFFHGSSPPFCTASMIPLAEPYVKCYYFINIMRFVHKMLWAAFRCPTSTCSSSPHPACATCAAVTAFTPPRGCGRSPKRKKERCRDNRKRPTSGRCRSFLRLIIVQKFAKARVKKLSVQSAEVAGGHALRLAEHPVEAADRAEAALLGHLRDGQAAAL